MPVAGQPVSPNRRETSRTARIAYIEMPPKGKTVRARLPCRFHPGQQYLSILHLYGYMQVTLQPDIDMVTLTITRVLPFPLKNLEL